MAGVRTLVVWCPDWPVTAAVADAPGPVAAGDPVAVVAANRVVACSRAARDEGVRRGLRRREAQGCCPDLRVLEAAPAVEARCFEPVAVAVEAFTPGIEIVRPGTIAIGTRGPSRYFGGDQALASAVASAVDAAVATVAPGSPRCRVGVADGRFAAEQAARLAGGVAQQAACRPAGVAQQAACRPAGVALVVPPGGSRGFVAPLPVRSVAGTVGDVDLPGLLVRLGLRTLGQLAALPATAVTARFGPAGREAHRLACGLDERPPAARVPPVALAVEAELDPPADRVEMAAFVARSLASELHERLASLGLACTRVAIEAETEHGETLRRLWRHDGTLTAGAVAERVRWQLDGWLAEGGTSGGITRLRLAPDEVRPDHGHQAGFWGERGTDEGIARTLTRVQGLVGPDGVVTAVLGGGRHAAEQVQLVPWGDARRPGRPGTPVAADPPGLVGTAGTVGDHGRLGGAGGRRGRSSGRGRVAEVPPWPGRLPGPAPALVHVPPVAAVVLDAAGAPVTVSGRGEVSTPPARLAVGGGRERRIEGWAGPWPVEERWWEGGGRRRARFQVVLDGGDAVLVVREAGAWWLEATYD